MHARGDPWIDFFASKGAAKAARLKEPQTMKALPIFAAVAISTSSDDCCRESDDEDDEEPHDDDCLCCTGGPELAMLERDGGTNNAVLTMVFAHLLEEQPGTCLLEERGRPNVFNSHRGLGPPGSLYARRCLLLI